jgi:hypothetical protein
MGYSELAAFLREFGIKNKKSRDCLCRTYKKKSLDIKTCNQKNCKFYIEKNESKCYFSEKIKENCLSFGLCFFETIKPILENDKIISRVKYKDISFLTKKDLKK